MRGEDSSSDVKIVEHRNGGVGGRQVGEQQAEEDGMPVDFDFTSEDEELLLAIPLSPGALSPS